MRKRIEPDKELGEQVDDPRRIRLALMSSKTASNRSEKEA